jgi:hypothetical protein
VLRRTRVLPVWRNACSQSTWVCASSATRSVPHGRMHRFVHADSLGPRRARSGRMHFSRTRFHRAFPVLALLGCEGPDTVQLDTNAETVDNADGSSQVSDQPHVVDAGADAAPACKMITCGANASCNTATLRCECSSGFADSGGGCKAIAPGDPRSHTQVDVCAQWKSGHISTTAGSGWTAGATQCDPGTLSNDAVRDVLVRINMFRWMVGLGPVSESTGQRTTYMAGAAVASWNPPGTAGNPHFPDPSAKCYTQLGAQGTSTSNLGWGNPTAADAVDQYMIDSGNEQTFGHRRWLMNPPLGRVGIGYYAGGGPYGSAQSLGVFDGSGSGPNPTWVSFPPPGFVPVAAASWDWTFHGPGGDRVQLTVKRQRDGVTMPMTRLPLSSGYGSYDVTGFRPQGWLPVAGETYDVSAATTGTPITYEVKPVVCN